MLKWLIIADDFTGALDTGVHFASAGIPTKVYAEFSASDAQALPDTASSAVIINAETRHVSPQEAYRILYGMLKAIAVPRDACVYIKTDSALRGNIGAEFDAAMDALGASKLHFVPAMPQMKRTTQGGVQYINGKPVSESAFALDPFEPMRDSYIPEILQKQTSRPSTVIAVNQTAGTQEGILVYDALEETHMQSIAMQLKVANDTRLVAGCSGLASVLARISAPSAEPPMPDGLSSKLLVICGSLNSISVKQCNYAENMGAARYHLMLNHMDALASTIMRENQSDEIVIVDSFSDASVIDTGAKESISQAFSQLLKRILDEGCDRTVMIIGGDSLLSIIRALSITSVQPICELFPGTIVSSFQYQGRTIKLLSKSGGFGPPTLLCDIQEYLHTGKVKENHVV